MHQSVISALAFGPHVSELVSTVNNFHACLLKTLSKFLWHVHIVWLHLLHLLPASLHRRICKDTLATCIKGQSCLTARAFVMQML